MESKDILIPWGEIGYITFKRTYARRLKEDDPNSKTEEFWQVVQRELDASDKQLKVGFTEEEKKRYAEMRLNLKFSTAGRFMWQLGTKTVDKLGLPSLQNCAFVTVNNPIRPFTWAFEMLMLGSGVGYNIQKHNVYQLPKVKGKVKIERKDVKDADFIVPDTREGWVKLLGKVLKAHFYSGEGFTYSTMMIRSKGATIKGFGGTASGPEDLCWGIAEINKILNGRANKKLRPIDCLDIMNIIGMVVVAGNVRRSAQISIGDYDDIEYLKAKRWDLGSIPNWRAMSNNSIVAPENTDDLLPEFWETYNQGEPYGLINLELSKTVGRTGETQYHCSLKETENIVHKNMRMGIGMTGILQATEEQRSWLKDAYVWLREYDKEYSAKHKFPASIKLTTVKPSGTLSLLAGVTPGVHPNPAGPYYIRRVRISSQSPLVDVCRQHGYHIEYQRKFDGSEDKSTMVISFPCKLPETTPVAADYDWKTQMDMVRRMQAEWSDNSVSCTVYYKKEDIEDIKKYLKALAYLFLDAYNTTKYNRPWEF